MTLKRDRLSVAGGIYTTQQTSYWLVNCYKSMADNQESPVAVLIQLTGIETEIAK